MNERPTPETRKAELASLDDTGCVTRMEIIWETMERLERERDEARELLASEKSTRNAIIAKGIETERQLAEAREAFAIATDQLVQVQGELRRHPIEEQSSLARRVLDLLETGDIEQAKHELRKELE